VKTSCPASVGVDAEVLPQAMLAQSVIHAMPRHLTHRSVASRASSEEEENEQKKEEDAWGIS
jgi:hypothetical protein